MAHGKGKKMFEENAVASKMNNFYGSLVFQATLSKLSAPKRHDSAAGRSIQQDRIEKSWLAVCVIQAIIQNVEMLSA